MICSLSQPGCVRYRTQTHSSSSTNTDPQQAEDEHACISHPPPPTPPPRPDRKPSFISKIHEKHKQTHLALPGTTSRARYTPMRVKGSPTPDIKTPTCREESRTTRPARGGRARDRRAMGVPASFTRPRLSENTGIRPVNVDFLKTWTSGEK